MYNAWRTYRAERSTSKVDATCDPYSFRFGIRLRRNFNLLHTHKNLFASPHERPERPGASRHGEELQELPVVIIGLTKIVGEAHEKGTVGGVRVVGRVDCRIKGKAREMWGEDSMRGMHERY